MNKRSHLMKVIILCCMVCVLFASCTQVQDKSDAMENTLLAESLHTESSKEGSAEGIMDTVSQEMTIDSEEIIIQSDDIVTELEDIVAEPEDIVTEVEDIIAEPDDIETESMQGNSTCVYIGTESTGFKEYPVSLDGDATGEKLIVAISDLTGWNLSLSDDVISGKGGVSVSFSQECSLVTGPPEKQKEEFFAYDNYHLAQMILDSIQETLRKNFVMAPGDPTTLDIWYCMEGEAIEIEGITILLEEPWDEQNPFQ